MSKNETKATETAAPAPKFKVVKNVTLPILKKEDGKEIFVQATGPIYRGKEIKATGDKKMEPADLMPVVDLTTGEEMLLIANAVLKGTLEEEYPDNGYVGKSFSILQTKVPGKRYKNFTIKEIELS